MQYGTFKEVFKFSVLSVDFRIVFCRNSPYMVQRYSALTAQSSKFQNKNRYLGPITDVKQYWHMLVLKPKFTKTRTFDQVLLVEICNDVDNAVINNLTPWCISPHLLIAWWWRAYHVYVTCIMQASSIFSFVLFAFYSSRRMYLFLLQHDWNHIWPNP